MGADSHVSHIACSQQGSRNAFTASLLQMAHLSLMGISSGVRELRRHGQQLGTAHGGGTGERGLRT